MPYAFYFFKEGFITRNENNENNKIMIMLTILKEYLKRKANSL